MQVKTVSYCFHCLPWVYFFHESPAASFNGRGWPETANLMSVLGRIVGSEEMRSVFFFLLKKPKDHIEMD